MSFTPIPGTQPLTILPAVAPPVVYFLALALLPPFNHVSPRSRFLIAIVRNVLAISATILFARLPLCYYVSWSCGLTYILSLTGWYGASRVVDIFFITSPARIPRRVKRKLKPLDDPDSEAETSAPAPLPDARNSRKPSKRSYGLHDPIADAGASQQTDVDNPNSKLTTRRNSLISKYADGTLSMSAIRDAIIDNNPVSRKRHGTVSVEKSMSESHDDMKSQWRQRFLYAIDLETSMRGVGWSWTTADVRHSRHTWLPTLEDEFYQLFFSDIPMVTGALVLERYLYLASDPSIGINSLNWYQRALLTLSQGVFLFGTFSAGYTAGAIATAPLRRRYREWTTHNLAFWPPLNSEPLTSVTTVRQFWSRSWHRLFSRLFLVWGVWPGQWLERKFVPSSLVKRFDGELELGKVLGAFFISGIVHAAAGISINGGKPSQTFEWLFFWTSGIAVVVEELVQRAVYKARGGQMQHWYDPWIGRAWSLTVLLWSGQYFTRGWYDSGLVKEMVTLPVTVVRLALEYAIAALSYVHDYCVSLEVV